jgi:predicted permease
MTGLLDSFGFAIAVTGPIVVMLVMGMLLARWRIINDAFIEAGSRLVFNVLLPVLLFLIVSKTRFEQTANLTLVAVGVLGTLLAFVVMEWIATRRVTTAQNRGVVVQGAFRANLGVIGLAYAVNAYGEIALAASSLYLALVTALYNVLAVITLNRSLNRHRSPLTALNAIVRNPLIIAIVAALPFAYLEVTLPDLLLRPGEYVAQMTLPLALLCAGGSLSLAAMRLESRDAVTATLGKALLSPLLLTGVGYLAGLRGMELGIVFLMASAPTAASSYPMARAMGGNATLAANIIVLTTIASVVTTTLGMLLLNAAGLA